MPPCTGTINAIALSTRINSASARPSDAVLFSAKNITYVCMKYAPKTRKFSATNNPKFRIRYADCMPFTTPRIRSLIFRRTLIFDSCTLNILYNTKKTSTSIAIAAIIQPMFIIPGILFISGCMIFSDIKSPTSLNRIISIRHRIKTVINKSKARSTMTVPNKPPTGIRSVRLRMPQRVISPMRGNTKLAK